MACKKPLKTDLSNDQTCKSQCIFFDNLSKNVRFCVDTCLLFKAFVYNNQCFSRCPNLYLNNVCVSKCPSEFSIEKEINGCSSLCDFEIQPNSSQVCILNCIMIWMQESGKIKCVSVCIQPFSMDSRSKSCSSICNFDLQNVCISNCSKFYQTQLNRYQCVSICQQLVQNKYCVNICNGVFATPTTTSNVCSSTCTYTINNDRRYCNDYCNFINSLFGYQCVDRCADSYPISFPIGNRIQCLQSCDDCPQYCQNQICTSSCSSSFAHFIEAKECSSICLFQIFASRSLCLSRCIYIIQNIGGRQQCYDICLNSNESCQSCPNIATYYNNSCICQQYANYIVMNNICQCDQNHTHLVQGQCQSCPQYSLKDNFSCICQSNASYNIETNKCVCFQNLTLINNGSCAQCPNNSNLIPNIDNTSSCKCISNQIYSNSSNQCNCNINLSMLTNGSCIECPNFSTYSNQTCICLENRTYQNINNSCICKVNYQLQHNSCQSCPSYSYYQDSDGGICVCIINMYFQGSICVSQCTQSLAYILNRTCVSNCLSLSSGYSNSNGNYLCTPNCTSSQSVMQLINNVISEECTPLQCQAIQQQSINLFSLIQYQSLYYMLNNQTINNSIINVSQYNFTNIANFSLLNNCSLLNNVLVSGQLPVIPSDKKISILNWNSTISTSFYCVQLQLSNITAQSNSSLVFCQNSIISSIFSMFNMIIQSNITTSAGSINLVCNQSQDSIVVIFNLTLSFPFLQTNSQCNCFYQSSNNTNSTITNTSLLIFSYFSSSGSSILTNSDQYSNITCITLIIRIDGSSNAQSNHAFGGVHCGTNLTAINSVVYSSISFVNASSGMIQSGIIIGMANGSAQQTFIRTIISGSTTLSGNGVNSYVGFFGQLSGMQTIISASQFNLGVTSTQTQDVQIGGIAVTQILTFENSFSNFTLSSQVTNIPPYCSYGFICLLLGFATIKNSKVSINIKAFWNVGTIGSTQAGFAISNLRLNGNLTNTCINTRSFGLLIGCLNANDNQIFSSNISGSLTFSTNLGVSLVIGYDYYDVIQSHVQVYTSTVQAANVSYGGALVGAIQNIASGCTVTLISCSVTGLRITGTQFGTVIGGECKPEDGGGNLQMSNVSVSDCLPNKCCGVGGICTNATVNVSGCGV